MDVEKLAERYIQTNKADKKLKEEIFYTVNGVAPYVLKKMGLPTNNEDLLQEAYRIIWDLIDCYDTSKQTKFTTYMITYLFLNMKKFLRANSWFLHTPTYITDLLVKINDPTKPVEEIAKEHNITQQQAYNVQLAAKRNSTQSVEEDPVDISYPFADFDTAIMLELALNTLNPQEYIVFQLSMDGYKQKEIAEQLECTQTYVSRLLRSAIDKLKQELSAE